MATAFPCLVDRGYGSRLSLRSAGMTPAPCFCQMRGFRIVAVHIGVVDMMRRLEPAIPETGIDGIPMRDEIELEMVL
ncbi:MAG: hypothetical protein M5U07_17475 [Xanthobacteraceae bacterium]|nr:hypothetical protein [Xanthobacteraceae bacterium]